MKKLTIAMLMLVLLLSGCDETIKSIESTTNNQFNTQDNYDGDFGQDWLKAIEDATKYPGNVHGYYEDGILYPVEYNIYFADSDYWLTIDGENQLDKTRQLMEIPAWIYLSKDDDKYIVSALVCEFDQITKVG